MINALYIIAALALLFMLGKGIYWWGYTCGQFDTNQRHDDIRQERYRTYLEAVVNKTHRN